MIDQRSKNAKLHSVLLIIADEVDRICRNNEIDYSLYGGTLIGALRHKGFIPWDDDFDISMTRNNYERFIDKCRTELGREFRLVSIETDKDYSYGFAKIALRGTAFRQDGYSKRHKLSELYIDIFPFDNVPGNRIKRYIHKFKNYYLIKFLQEHYDGYYMQSASTKKIAIFKIIEIINLFTNKEKMKRALEKNEIKYKNTQTDYITSMASRYGYDREMRTAEEYKKYRDIEFENRTYRCISDYEPYLKKVFGDYMKLPPENERKTHDFAFIDFGGY